MVKKNRMAFFDADALSMYLKFFCYFINYTISFYNIPYISKLYYFTFSLKYYFLIFFIISFPSSLFFRIPKVTFSCASELFLFFFPDFAFSNSHIFLGYATLFFFQQWCWFQWPFLGLYHFFSTVMFFQMETQRYRERKERKELKYQTMERKISEKKKDEIKY